MFFSHYNDMYEDESIDTEISGLFCREFFHQKLKNRVFIPNLISFPHSVLPNCVKSINNLVSSLSHATYVHYSSCGIIIYY